MLIGLIAKEIGADLMTDSPGGPVEIHRVHASDRISDLLKEVDDNTLLVTNLSHPMLMRPIELMDAAAVCLLNGVVPDPGLVDAAKAHGAAVMVSPYGMYETCGRLYRLLTVCQTTTNCGEEAGGRRKT
jgi:hypothetical protein